MRAYSHQGHGPRADQTGRIHISDFRYLRTISLAKCSRSIHAGQTRKSAVAIVRSGLPPESRLKSDIAACRFRAQEETYVPQQNNLLYSITSSARASSVGGISKPSALAALRLMTSSNLVG